jgi:hypothetical protein
MLETKYYKAEIFNEKDEISLSEAITVGSYVCCYYTDNSLTYAEHVSDGLVLKIIYYNQVYPNHSLLESHLALHKNYPFDIISFSSEANEKAMFEIYQCNNLGQIEAITELHIDQEGNYLLEAQMDADKNLYGKTEYEYSKSGVLSLVREISPDGKILAEYDPD